ncbi:hypothetical protein [Propionicicella superfundia]|uniref:hypothetical protein n=1 Tax=Propionicicella superfundia TaxID=348582 RepID=UPI00055BA5AD|nr:hypothetical protein [Propionicicella superfundia]
MTARTARHDSSLRIAAAAAMAGLVLASGGCSAGTAGETTPASPGASVAVTIPSDGITLRALGFSNGPGTAFSIPHGSVLTSRIDQENVVTMVFAEPSGETLRAYLVRALPAAGFTIAATADDALTFAGHGWSGSFVGGAESAVTLRRQ